MPEKLVEAEVHAHLEGENRLEDDEHRAEVTEEVTNALRTQFVLDTIVDKEEVSVTQGELIEYLVAQAPRYGMDANAFAQAVDQAGQVPAMVGEVARRKGLAVVLESATITDVDGQPVDLDDLVPPRPAAEGAEDHDHEGHDHEGHDHEGHDHEGHDHDHEGHGHGPGHEVAEPGDAAIAIPLGQVELDDDQK